MALAAVVDSVDKIPEAQRSLYIQREGKFVLDIEGTPNGFVTASELATEKGKVVEFRENNTKLIKEVEELRPLKTKFGDLDPVTARKAVDELAELKKTGINKPDDVTTIVKAAVEAAITPFREQITQQSTKLESERVRADEATLKSAISTQFSKAGGRASAFDYIFGKSKDSFEVRDGNVTAKAAKFSPSNPSNPLSIEEWMAAAIKTEDFAFAPSQGGGASGSGSSSGAGLRADQRVITNPTPQQLGDPKLAKEIKDGKLRFAFTS